MRGLIGSIHRFRFIATEKFREQSHLFGVERVDYTLELVEMAKLPSRVSVCVRPTFGTHTIKRQQSRQYSPNMTKFFTQTAKICGSTRRYVDILPPQSSWCTSFTLWYLWPDLKWEIFGEVYQPTKLATWTFIMDDFRFTNAKQKKISDLRA